MATSCRRHCRCPLPPPAAAAAMAKQLRQAQAVLRAGRDYLRYDLPEIVFPSSMPNPPGVEPKPRRERREYVAVRGCAWRLLLCVHAAEWV